MKLLRCGNKNNEKPAALDKNGKIRDLSSNVSDFDPENFVIISPSEDIRTVNGTYLLYLIPFLPH